MGQLSRKSQITSGLWRVATILMMHSLNRWVYQHLIQITFMQKITHTAAVLHRITKRDGASVVSQTSQDGSMVSAGTRVSILVSVLIADMNGMNGVAIHGALNLGMTILRLIHTVPLTPLMTNNTVPASRTNTTQLSGSKSRNTTHHSFIEKI